MRKEHRSWLVVTAVTALVVLVGMRMWGPATQAQQRPRPAQTMIWSLIKDAGAPAAVNVYRTPVPGGWLVMVHHTVEKSQHNAQGYGFGAGIGAGATFVPDPQHTWKTL